MDFCRKYIFVSKSSYLSDDRAACTDMPDKPVITSYVGPLVRYRVLPETDRLQGRLSWGFVDERSAAADERLAIPELNSGFIAHELTAGLRVTEIKQYPGGVSAENRLTDEPVPLSFVTDVPAEGVYRVTLTVNAAAQVRDGLIFLGRRRLALKKDWAEGESYTGSFLTHICPVIPRGRSAAEADGTLDITLVGAGLALYSVTVEACTAPVIYIAGDSTVTDQSAFYPYHPGRSYCGWGQMLSCFTRDRAAVSDHAHSGLTTASMRSEGHYAILYDRIGQGDICLFQFAHNDQKLAELKAREGYRDNLGRYIDEILAKGATPVIVSPLARNTWKGDGTYNDLLAEYADVCREITEQRHVPFIDLHGYSMAMILEKGREGARSYYYPSDYTHSNDYGGYLFAGYVYSELVRLGLTEKAPGTGCAPDSTGQYHFDEWEPVAAPEFVLPEGTPGGCGPDMTAEAAGTAAAESIIDRPDELLLRAEALQLVITTMKFFPTNVYNDMFTDVVGHETYAGSVECAYQNGIIPECMVHEGRLEPDRPITVGEFFEVLKLGYLSRRPDDGAVERLRPADLSDGMTITRGRAAELCSRVRI